MKALLYKDFYTLWKYCKTYFLMCAFFLTISVFDQSQQIFGLYPLVLMGMLPMTAIAYDERDKWETNALTMPFSRRQLVTEKYLFTLILMGMTFCITAVASFLNLWIAGSFDPMEYVGGLSVRLVLAMVGPAIMLPMVFKFGAEKGRLAYVIALVVILGAGVGVILLTQRLGLTEFEVDTWLAVLAVAGVLLIFPASWRLSVRFYEKREF